MQIINELEYKIISDRLEKFKAEKKAALKLKKSKRPNMELIHNTINTLTRWIDESEVIQSRVKIGVMSGERRRANEEASIEKSLPKETLDDLDGLFDKAKGRGDVIESSLGRVKDTRHFQNYFGSGYSLPVTPVVSVLTLYGAIMFIYLGESVKCIIPRTFENGTNLRLVHPNTLRGTCHICTKEEFNKLSDLVIKIF